MFDYANFNMYRNYLGDIGITWEMLLKCKLPGPIGHPLHLQQQGAAIRYLRRQQVLSAAERKKPGQEVHRRSLVTDCSQNIFQ